MNNQGLRIPHSGISPLCSKSLYGFIRCIGQADRDIEINGRILNGGNNTENWLLRQRNQRSNCQNLLDPGKSKRVPEKHLFLLY